MRCIPYRHAAFRRADLSKYLPNDTAAVILARERGGGRKGVPSPPPPPPSIRLIRSEAIPSGRDTGAILVIPYSWVPQFRDIGCDTLSWSRINSHKINWDKWQFSILIKVKITKEIVYVFVIMYLYIDNINSRMKLFSLIAFLHVSMFYSNYIIPHYDSQSLDSFAFFLPPQNYILAGETYF